MKRWLLVALLAACGGDKHDVRSQSGGSGQPEVHAEKAAAPVAHTDKQCGPFADRVLECTTGPGSYPYPESERPLIRRRAYTACMHPGEDAEASHYYGDVDKKIACMQGKDCKGVSWCLTCLDSECP